MENTSWTVNKSCFTVNRNVVKPIPKSLLIPLELIAAASTANILMTNIHKKRFRFGIDNISNLNKEVKDIMTIIKSFEESGLLIKDASKTIKKWNKKTVVLACY